MANFPSYTLKDFKSSQNLIARDPAGSGTLIRVNGQSILDSAVAEILAQDGLLQAIDTLTEAVATDYSSGVYVLVGGEVAVLDGGTALYRVSDAGSGGVVMDNGNELVALIVSLIEAAELTAQAAVSAEEAAASELAVSTNAAQVAIDADLAQTAASEAATSAATYDNFDQLYLGSKATAPALDNEGNALISGAEYFDTTLNAKYTWNGSAWVATNATGLGTASLVDYETITGSLDDNFTSGSFTAVRVGRMVTLTISDSTFSSNPIVETSSGTIPVGFRPAQSVQNASELRSDSIIEFNIDQNGTIGLLFRDWSGRVFDRTSCVGQVISYITS